LDANGLGEDGGIKPWWLNRIGRGSGLRTDDRRAKIPEFDIFPPGIAEGHEISNLIEREHGALRHSKVPGFSQKFNRQAAAS